ncbi:MAG: isochorismatase family protein, partial [Rhizobiaceae bacterium]|nr:isochorismatase family protein [Rhizobiaceae bacterium]
VDMQNDFGSEGGMFDRAGVDIAPIKAIVPRIVDVVADARAAGMTVVFLRQQHSADLADTGGPQSPHSIKHRPMQLGASFPAPDGKAGRVLIRGTWNTDNVPELTPQPDDIVIGKPRYSGFFNTDLDARLRHEGIKYLVFTGATTSICVESTVRDAMFRDYVCLVLEDCTAEPIAANAARSNHEASLLNIELLFGWVAKAADLRAALHMRRQAAE